MKINSIKIHNFRSFIDEEIITNEYSCLVGPNNSGKSNFIDCLRIFYEDKIKFNYKSDFPIRGAKDEESWIEIEYQLSDSEYNSIKTEYQSPNNTIKVRKIFYSSDSTLYKTNQSNIFGYENGILSKNLFYGAKNISNSKLGSVIYIPEVTSTDDNFKLSGPSPFKVILDYVVKRVMEKSNSYKSLTKSFDKFNRDFQNETSSDGVSLKELQNNINKNIKEWNVDFQITINPISPDNIIKNLTSQSVIDKELEHEMNIKSMGQGFQRQLIYTLIKIAPQYTDEKEISKKDFNPNFTLILFEEPEAFLHPGQQEILNLSLLNLSHEDNSQILVSTHSPFFISKNIEDITSIIKINKTDGLSKCYQVSIATQMKLAERNTELVELLRAKLLEEGISNRTKSRIEEIIGTDPDEKRLEEETLRYALWLDSERCCSFFANQIIICEGATERTYINFLMKNYWSELNENKIYILDSLGKFNFHRYMNLFNELGISHSIIADTDPDNKVHQVINNFIKSNTNSFTKEIFYFSNNFESFLGIESPPRNRSDKKPLNVMWNHSKGNIPQEKINELKSIIKSLI
jgi:predicted ATP-dependent endonuclease of OLD family